MTRRMNLRVLNHMLSGLLEQLEGGKIVDHEHKVTPGSVAWHFHNKEHGISHCSGPASNPYKVRHVRVAGRLQHAISLNRCVGHGAERKRVWFRFPKRLPGGGYWLECGVPENGRP